MKRFVLGLLVAGSCIVPAMAGERLVATVTTVVPLVCEVELSGRSLVPGREDVGTLREVCNNGEGYRVIARPTGDVTGGKLVVDGREIGIETGVDVEIAVVAHASIKERTIRFVAGSMETNGELSVRIEAR